MSNQEIEKQTFQDYLTVVFDSENLTISTCNTEDDFDFKAAPDSSLSDSSFTDRQTDSNQQHAFSSMNTNNSQLRDQQKGTQGLKNQLNYQQSNSGQQGGGQQRQAAKAAFRQKCRTILNRQALRQEKTILEPGQIRFRALGNYLNSLQQQDIQNQSPEIVGIIENMTDLMNQMVDIDIDMMSFYPEESDKAMAEEAKTKLEKDITVYLNNYLNTLEENQRDSLIRRIKKFRVKMKKRTDDKTTQGQKQPVTTTTTSNTTTLLIPRPPGPQTSGDSRRKKRRNSNSSSKPGHGLNDHSLSSVLTDPDEQNQQQFMNRLSSLEPTHKGISSLLRQSDKILRLLIYFQRLFLMLMMPSWRNSCRSLCVNMNKEIPQLRYLFPCHHHLSPIQAM